MASCHTSIFEGQDRKAIRVVRYDMAEISDWLFEQTQSDRVWLAKRLSANDVGATKSHQDGVYLSKSLASAAFPGLLDDRRENQKRECTMSLRSHGWSGSPVCTWYNQGTRNEVRLTRWGHGEVVFRDEAQVGGLLVLSVRLTSTEEAEIDAWLARDVEEEDTIEALVGDVVPGDGLIFHPQAVPSLTENTCTLSPREIRQKWGSRFPSTQELVRLAVERRPGPNLTVDQRLIQRRDCEEAAFYAVERVHTLELIRAGFSSVTAFVSCASSVLNRRKSRAGRSLELHLKTIFDEVDIKCSHNERTEGDRRPDFVFPSIDQYQDHSYPVRSLRVLGVKTTLKDRWRQVITEAGRLARRPKHLFTLQQGVSVSQFEEMTDAGVQLVVPKALFRSYPQTLRPRLISLADFCSEVRAL